MEYSELSTITGETTVHFELDEDDTTMTIIHVNSAVSSPQIESLQDVEDSLDKLNELQAQDDQINQEMINTRCMRGIHQWRVGPTDPLTSSTFVTNKIAMISTTLYQGHGSEGDQSLLEYFSSLSKKDETAAVDYVFLSHLLSMADVNIRDEYGQTMIHEVARDWHTDFALFLKTKGADIDVADSWGRTPLFVAVSSNHIPMVKWLIKNGANIHRKTMKGERHGLLHFAAKHDSVEAFEELLKHGLDPMEVDHHKRTPFYLAADKGHHRMCHLMLEMELPVATYCDAGIATIDKIVLNLSNDVVEQALNQYIERHTTNTTRCSYYLSYLTKRKWKTMQQETCSRSRPQTAVQILIDQKNLSLITHPAILQYLEIQWKFCKVYVYQNILWYFLFTFVWTISASMQLPRRPYDHSDDFLSYTIILFGGMATLVTLGFIVKFILEYKALSAREREKLLVKVNETERDIPFCHPAWAFEMEALQNRKVTSHRNTFALFFSDGYNIIEAFVLILSLLQLLFTVRWYIYPDEESIFNTRMYFSSFFLIVTWLRLNKCLRFLQSIGPFIAMLGECVIATARFGFLFFEFFIPFTCTFWVLFGGIRKDHEGNEYEHFNDMLYQLYLLTMVGDYELDPLKEVNQVMAQFLVCVYLIVVSIISLNLYVALLSEGFSRVMVTAGAVAYLKEATELDTWMGIVPGLVFKFESYICQQCSPMVANIRHRDKDESVTSVLLEALKQGHGLSEMLQETGAEVHKINYDFDTLSNTVSKLTPTSPDTITRLSEVFNFHTARQNVLQRKAFRALKFLKPEDGL